LQDLARPATTPYEKPTYVIDNEDESLERLVRKIKHPDFRQESKVARLKCYYHLGEILASRGWNKTDSQYLKREFGQRTVRDVKKTARRVYELFYARGTAQIVAVTSIRPAQLLGMKDEDFYGKLIPGARRLAQEDSNEENRRFAGAHH
jgi:hypothetical protein